MSKRKNKLNFTFRVVKDGNVVDRCQTHSKRRFYNRMRTINWQNNSFKVYLRVSYGKKIFSKGCLCSFYNDGWYDNKTDLWQAVNAFVEEC